MKKILITLLYLFMIHLAFSENINEYKEEVILTIDRNLYVIDEYISFSAHILTEQETISKVMYIEIITPTGRQISGVKYKIKNNIAAGKIKIPANINTGNYYIRSYTKYMRNYGPHSYSYQLLKIINPYKNDILNGSLISDTASVFKAFENNSGFFKLSINTEQPNSRENVKINIKKLGADSLLNLIVAVSPQSATDFKQVKFKKSPKSNMNFFPETRGISLTGVLKDKLSDTTLHRKVVNLTILDEEKHKFYSAYTQLHGRFFFSLPDCTGNKDIFLSSEHTDNAEPVLLIDNDFCAQNISLPNPKFSLTKEEQIIAYKMATNLEVYKHFAAFSTQKSETKELTNDTLPFYGLPTHVLLLDNYISLPTFEDYFTEIPFVVKIKKEKDHKKFKIIGTHHELNIYEPLIMVDLVPIYNINHILEIPPQKIERIEVINEPYIKGDLTYGGIINIISVNNDFGGVKLPDSGIFLNYSFYYNQTVLPSIPISQKYPDPRNTLYWNPKLTLDAGNKLEIPFQTGDTKGKYIISVIGITTAGEIVYSSVDFEVK